MLCAFLIGATVSVNAQKTIEEGVIKMEITEVSSDNPQIAAQLEMMKGTKTEYYFNKEKSLVVANMMGGMMKMQNLVNNSDEHLTLLMEMMGQKIMIESTKAERDKFEAEQNAEMPELDIVYDENDKKTILGYECIKATVTSPDPSTPMNFSMYVSKEIKASNKMVQGLQTIDLEGFPLEITIDMEQMKLTATTQELNDSVDSSVFEINTNGYQKMSFEEFQQSMGAMGGGGMGF